jgi:multidrug resistance efflux pump
MTHTRRPSRLVPLLGAAVLAASLGGAGWMLRAHAGGGTPAGEATPQKPVCFGYADVEAGVASLYPLQPGQVERVAVKEGQAVHAGDVLVRVDRRTAECLVRQARADLAAARAQQDQARQLLAQQPVREAEQQAVLDGLAARLRAAEWVLARREELRGVQVSDKEVEAARAQCDEVKAMIRGEERKLDELRLNDPRQALARAEADVDARQARLDQALLALEQCDLKAPADGTVLRVLVSPGDLLGPQPKQPAVLFCPDAPRIVRAEVDQEFAAGVAVGWPAFIQDDSRAGPTWHGQVYRVSDWYTHRRSILQEPLQLNDVRTLECLIAVDSGQPSLRIGQRVLVTLQPPAAPAQEGTR